MPGVGQSYHGGGDRICAPAAALPMADQISPDALEACIRLVDEHVQAGVERDLNKIMRTWARTPASTTSPGTSSSRAGMGSASTTTSS